MDWGDSGALESKKRKKSFQKEERPVRDNDEIVTCFRDGEVTLRSNRRIDGFTNAMKEVGYQGVRRGDLVIHNMDAFAGAIGVSDSDGKSTPVYSVCTPKNNVEANVYYYAYLLRSYALGGVIQSLAKGIRERSTDFRYKEFGDLYYQQPPIEEQQSIASYLDQKCGEIDKLITLQEEMITKLQSYKQSVITEAVTKGLDKNLPLKDSGIEWIGEIPEHWSVVKIKYLAKIKSGDSISSNEIMQEGIYEVYGGNGLMGFCNKKNVDGVNIIIGRVGALCGNVRLISESKFITDNALILNCFDNALYSYMYIMLKAANLNNLNTSNAQPLITGSKVLNVSLPIPSLSEQQSIADYLDQKCSEIDELISIKQQKIEKLKDYKKSLIFECVTGKRKV